MKFIVFFLFSIYIISSVSVSTDNFEVLRIYEKGRQFLPEDENLPLSTIATFSLYMGDLRYPHLQLLLESMKWNPTVKFIVIHVIEEGSTQADKLIALKAAVGVPNLQIVAITIPAFSDLVNRKLGLEVEMNIDWRMKLRDYKPILGFLFADMIPESDFKYWGFADLDLIWGNFSRFAHWFQGDQKEPFVISGWFTTKGAAAWFLNTNDTRTLFMTDSTFVSLLKNKTYYNLEESGTETSATDIPDLDRHALAWLMGRYLDNIKDSFLNRGRSRKEHCYIDQDDSLEWAGPVRWFHGQLQILHSSPEFPARREILFYHRPEKEMDFPAAIQDEIFNEMATFGYLLPNWIPLSTKYVCKATGKSSGTLESAPVLEGNKAVMVRKNDSKCIEPRMARKYLRNTISKALLINEQY